MTHSITKITNAEEAAAWHEEQRDIHMVYARGFRNDLDRLQIEDPDEYAHWDCARTIGNEVYRARWHNRVAWLIRWHERTRPRQMSMFGGATS